MRAGASFLALAGLNAIAEKSPEAITVTGMAGYETADVEIFTAEELGNEAS